jgi:DNA-binding NarL/FixJ family response regulator
MPPWLFWDKAGRMSVIRVLVVDDFEPWRLFVASTLQKRPGLRIVCEASDGLQAVHKAEQLQPELILLDIGLPTLNGIEAARRIRGLAPSSQIIFLSENYASDIAQAALDLGARGYVVKADAGRELLPAIEAVIEGRQFVSARLAGQVFAPPDSQRPAMDLSERILTQLPSQQLNDNPRHEVQFYPDDAAFLDGFARFISTALDAGSAVIVAVTDAHRDELRKRLQLLGVNIAGPIKEGIFVQLDPREILSKFMVNGLPDSDRFWEVAGSLIETAKRACKGEYRRVAACGECAPSLWLEGKADAAIRLEALWDEAAKTFGVDILCGYPLPSFRNEEDRRVFSRICSIHSAVIPRDVGSQTA